MSRALPLVLSAALLACIAVGLRAQATASRPSASTAATVKAAQQFLASLDPSQTPKASYAFGDAIKAKWHNLPPNMAARAGIPFRDLTAAQQDLGLEVLKSVLSTYGYQKVQSIMAADAYLGRNMGAAFPTGPSAYMIAIFGTPSLTQPWEVQFNGHHLGVNVTIVGSDNVLAPTLTAAYPNMYEDDGRTVVVLADEATRALKLIQALNAAQRDKAIQKTQVWDFVLGPGHDNQMIQPEGLKGSDMTASERTMMLDVAAAWVNIVDDASARAKLAEIRRNLGDTYFLWSGDTTTAGNAYFRVQGPTVLIEYAPQTLGGPGSATFRGGGRPGGGAPAARGGDGAQQAGGGRGRGTFDAVANDPNRKLDPVHVHTVYRDFTNDYGKRLIAAR